MYRSLFLALLFFVGAQALAVTLNETVAMELCTHPASPCDFSEADIWEFNTNPSEGDTVTVAIQTPVRSVYINLAQSINLESLLVSGGITFWVVNPNTVLQIGQFTAAKNAQVQVDNTVETQDVVVHGGAVLTIRGDAQFSVTDSFNNTGMDSLYVLDEATLSGNNFFFGGINTTSDATIIAQQVVMDKVVGEAQMIAGKVYIQRLVVDNMDAQFSGSGFIGASFVMAQSLTITGNFTMNSITLGTGCFLLVIGANLNLTGPVTGGGKIELALANLRFGNSSSTSHLEGLSVEFINAQNVATFDNVVFGSMVTDSTGNGETASNTFYFNDVMFRQDTDLIANITSTNLTVNTNTGLNITGDLLSTGALVVNSEASLEAGSFTQFGGMATLQGPVVSPMITFKGCLLFPSDTLIGSVSFSGAQVATSVNDNFIILGNLDIYSGVLEVAKSELKVTGDIVSHSSATSFVVINGTLKGETFGHGSGQLLLSGGRIVASSILFYQSQLVRVSGPTTLQGNVSIEDTTVALAQPLTIDGDLALQNNEITNLGGNITITVTGSMYSLQNYATGTPFIHYTAQTFSHIGEEGTYFFFPGSITANTISFTATDLVFTLPGIEGFKCALVGNTSLTAARVEIGGDAVVYGTTFVADVEFRSILKATFASTGPIIGSATNTLSYEAIITAPSFVQSGGELVVEQGTIVTPSLTINNGATLTFVNQTGVINGSVTLNNGNLKVQSFATINGNFAMDTLSQVKTYALPNNLLPLVTVNGNVAISGALVYWLNAKPSKEQVYKLFEYNGKLTGKFSSVVAYGPDNKVVKVDVNYANNQVIMVFNPTKPSNPGLVVAIVLPTSLVVIGVVIGVLYYRQRRKEYRPI